MLHVGSPCISDILYRKRGVPMGKRIRWFGYPHFSQAHSGKSLWRYMCCLFLGFHEIRLSSLRSPPRHYTMHHLEMSLKQNEICPARCITAMQQAGHLEWFRYHIAEGNLRSLWARSSFRSVFITRRQGFHQGKKLFRRTGAEICIPGFQGVCSENAQTLNDLLRP